jgi:hypothetical protein
MRLFFWRRRALLDFADAIRPELRAMTTPEPSPELLERILASRTAQVRVILPDPTTSRSRVSRRAIVIAAIAAAVLLVVVPSIRRPPAIGDDVIASSVFFAREAYASPLNGAERTGLSPVALARPQAIHPLALEFSRRVRDATGQLVTESADSLTVALADVNGTPAWQITSRVREVVGTQRRVETETLYVARADLRMLERAVHVSPYSRFERINIQQRFHGDSVTGRMTTDGPSIGAGRAIARVLGPERAPYLTDAFAPIALMSAPISSTWSGSAALLGWAVVPRDVFVPIELRVEGEERLTVPAGTFDCWRISIRIGGGEISYWVRRSDGLGVRVLDERDRATKGTRETVLTRVTE